MCTLRHRGSTTSLPPLHAESASASLPGPVQGETCLRAWCTCKTLPQQWFLAGGRRGKVSTSLPGLSAPPAADEGGGTPEGQSSLYLVSHFLCPWAGLVRMCPSCRRSCVGVLTRGDVNNSPFRRQAFISFLVTQLGWKKSGALHGFLSSKSPSILSLYYVWPPLLGPPGGPRGWYSISQHAGIPAPRTWPHRTSSYFSLTRSWLSINGRWDV